MIEYNHCFIDADLIPGKYVVYYYDGGEVFDTIPAAKDWIDGLPSYEDYWSA